MSNQLQVSTFSMEGEFTSGSEHHVCLNRQKGEVYKELRRFGKFWQNTDKGIPKRDLASMYESGVSVVPTEVYEDVMVKNGDNARRRVTYLLRQPFLEGASSLTYAMLHHSADLRMQLWDFFLQGQEIRERDNLGFDMLGGQIFKMFLPVINPRMKPLNPVIANLLVPSHDVASKISMPQLGIEAGAIIAKAGIMQQCDTRMYDLNRAGLKGWLLTQMLSRIQEAQDTCLSALLHSFNMPSTGFDVEANSNRRLIRYLFERAIPKMHLYAEKNAT